MRLTSLTSYLGTLNSLTSADFQGSMADDYLAEISIDQDELAHFIYFREQTYGRNLITKNAYYELIVLTWLPGQRTPIHDHFGQRCWMRVVSGELTFRNYAFPVRNDQGLQPLGGAEHANSPNQIYIDDSIATHSITNASHKPAISLHLYAGPVPQCRIYNEQLAQFETVSLSYFTVGGEPTFKKRHPDLQA